MSGSIDVALEDRHVNLVKSFLSPDDVKAWNTLSPAIKAKANAEDNTAVEATAADEGKEVKEVKAEVRIPTPKEDESERLSLLDSITNAVAAAPLGDVNDDGKPLSGVQSALKSMRDKGTFPTPAIKALSEKAVFSHGGTLSALMEEVSTWKEAFVNSKEPAHQKSGFMEACIAHVGRALRKIYQDQE